MNSKEKKSSIWTLFRLLDSFRSKINISGHPSEYKLILALNRMLNVELFKISGHVVRRTSIKFVDSLHSTSVLFCLYLNIPPNFSGTQRSLLFYKQILLYTRACIRFCADMRLSSRLIGSNNCLETRKILFYAYPSHAFNSADNLGNGSINYYLDDYIRSQDTRTYMYTFRSYVRPSAQKKNVPNLLKTRTLHGDNVVSLIPSLVSTIESKLNSASSACNLYNLLVELVSFSYLLVKALLCRKNVFVIFVAFVNNRCSSVVNSLSKWNIALHTPCSTFHFSPALEHSRELGSNLYQHVYSVNNNNPPSSTVCVIQPITIKELLPYITPTFFSITLLSFPCSASAFFKATFFKILFSNKNSAKILNQIVLPDPGLMKARLDQADIELHSCLLGYETTILNPSRLIEPTTTGRYIIVYDIPPDFMSKQLQYSCLGSPTNSIEFVSAFLRDIDDVCHSMDVTILLKPKYSLSNYSIDYLELINSISAANENFYVLNPYSRILESDSSSFLGVIAAPFTSILKLSRTIRPINHYYAPIIFKEMLKDNPFQNDYPLLVGRDMLNLTLLAAL